MIKNLLLLRIDERMNHGQVMISYMKKYPAKYILCIDDATASDTFLSGIIKMSAPPVVKIDVATVEESIKILNAGLNKATIILAKTPLTVKALRERGIDIDEFIIGGMSEASGKRRFYKSIFITPDEEKAVGQMLQAGVKIDVQIVASDKRIPASTLLK